MYIFTVRLSVETLDQKVWDIGRIFTRGLYSEDNVSRYFPLIFHMEYSVYSIGTVLIFFNGCHFTSHLEHTARGIYRVSCIQDKSLVGMF